MPDTTPATPPLPAAQAAANRKRIKLALQGGGAHGAFTWGVLDRLLADERLEIEALVGTSAGAMNAAIVADGLAAGGSALAREMLRAFWEGAASLARFSPVQPTPFDRMFGPPGSMAFSPVWQMADVLTRMLSPYEFNPGNANPLRDLLAQVVDFPRLRAATEPALFVCATNVLNGRLRVFSRAEMTPQAVMASSCIPTLFQAEEVEGEHYWDGGYCGNPPIFPVIYMGGAPDILVVQLNPINIPDVPRDARAIIDRMNTLAFNSSLMREMRAVKFVTDLIDRGELDPARYTRIFIHTIDAEAELAGFDASSKLNADAEFLARLHALGVARADSFLAENFEAIGTRSSTDIVTKFF
jgi:NTE family protein